MPPRSSRPLHPPGVSVALSLAQARVEVNGQHFGWSRLPDRGAARQGRVRQPAGVLLSTARGRLLDVCVAEGQVWHRKVRSREAVATRSAKRTVLDFFYDFYEDLGTGQESPQAQVGHVEWLASSTASWSRQDGVATG